MLSLCLVILAVTDGGVPSRFQTEARPGPAGEVSGAVVDERGAPVAGVKLRFSGGSHHRMVSISAETGADGRFSATGVRSGPFGTQVQVEAPGFASMVHTLDAMLTAGALTLDVRLGKPVKVAGLITGPDATGGGLRLIDAPPPGVDLQKWRTAAQPRVMGVLGSNGAFALEALEGDYELEWARPAGRPFYALVHAPSPKLRLSPSKAALTGQALSATGTPLADAEVMVTDLAANPPPSMFTRTDAQGRFVLRGVEDGEYLVEATAKQVCHAQKVKVARGAGALTVRFGGGWTFQGQVLDGDGRGLATQVLATPAKGLAGSLCGVRTARSDPSGQFSIADLTADEVDVSALSKPPPDLLRVKKGEGPVLLRVPAKGLERTVKGVVLGPDRQPIAGAMVGEGGSFTDDQGRFTLARGPNDRPVVAVYRRCYVRKEVSEADAAVVTMERRPCLSATVIDAAKRPVSGMHSLQLKRADGTLVSTCTTRRAEGDCTLEAELGALTLSGALMDGRSVSTKLELKDSVKQEVVLVAP